MIKRPMLRGGGYKYYASRPGVLKDTKLSVDIFCDPVFNDDDGHPSDRCVAEQAALQHMISNGTDPRLKFDNLVDYSDRCLTGIHVADDYCENGDSEKCAKTLTNATTACMLKLDQGRWEYPDVINPCIIKDRLEEITANLDFSLSDEFLSMAIEREHICPKP